MARTNTLIDNEILKRLRKEGITFVKGSAYHLQKTGMTHIVMLPFGRCNAPPRDDLLAAMRALNRKAK